MTHEAFYASDLMKFYSSLNTGNKIEGSFKNSAFDALTKLVNKEIPVAELESFGFELGYGKEDDDICVDGLRYDGGYTVYFDGIFADEEEMVYSDASPVSVEIAKEGCEIISPEIVIGKPLTEETVLSVLDGNVTAKVGTGKLDDRRSIIECVATGFDLMLIVEDGILKRAEILAISCPEELLK